MNHFCQENVREYSVLLQLLRVLRHDALTVRWCLVPLGPLMPRDDACNNIPRARGVSLLFGTIGRCEGG